MRLPAFIEDALQPGESDFTLRSGTPADIEALLEPGVEEIGEEPPSPDAPPTVDDDIEALLEPSTGPQFVKFGGRSVPYADVERVAAKMKTTPEAILRIGTSAGQFESRLAKTAVGQTLLRAEQGLSDAAVAGLDLLSRAGVPGIDRGKLQKEQTERAAYLDFIEKGSDLEAVLGARGSRIYGNVQRSIGSVAAASVAGPTALYSAIGAQEFDRALNEGEKQGLSGAASVVYAGKRAAVETGITYLFGKANQALGVRSLEEGLTPGMRAAATRFSERSGVPAKIAEFVKGLKVPEAVKGAAPAVGGAVSEFAEESIVDALSQNIDITEGFQQNYNWAQTLEAGVAGLAGAGLVESARTLSETLSAKTPEIAGIAQAVNDAEDFVRDATPEQVDDVLTAETPKELSKAARVNPADVDPQMYFDEFVAEVKRSQTVDAEGPAPATPNTAAESRAVASSVLSPPGSYTARNIDLARDAELLGIDSYYSPGVRGQALVHQEAVRRGIPQHALTISQRILKGAEKLNDISQEGLKIRWAQLNNEYTGLREKLAAAKDDIDAATHGAELSRIREEAETIKEALNVGGTETARTLVNRRFGISDDYSPLGLTASAIAAKKNALSADERLFFESLADQENSLSEKHDAAEAKLRDSQALKILGDLTKRSGVPDDIKDLYRTAQQLFDGGCDF